MEQNAIAKGFPSRFVILVQIEDSNVIEVRDLIFCCLKVLPNANRPGLVPTGSAFFASRALKRLR